MSEATLHAPPCTDDTCDGWPGVEHGVRAPYVSETQLSWDEVYYGLAAGLIGSEVVL
jgi:hypothetical protein